MTTPRAFLIFTALALPWLSPFAGGPSAAAVPWVVSLLCVAVMGWAAAGAAANAAVRADSMERRGKIPRKLVVGFAVMVALFGLHALRGVAAGTGAGVEAIATVVALLALGVMVWVGAWTVALPSTAGGLWRTVAKVWLAVALVSVGMALCQYLRVEHWFAPWISASGDGTAFANLRQRNQFATLCGMGLLALLYLRQTAPTAARPSWFDLAWPWAAAAVLALGNALSSSRTGGLQWLLVALVLWCWRGSLHARVRWLGFGALGYYVVALVLMPWLADAVGNASSGLWGRVEQGAGGFSRLALYSNTLDLIAQKPWLGWGWRELAYAHYSTHFDNRFMELLDNAHNLPLHLAVELGLPFALAVCGALVWWVWRSAPWRETDAARQLAWAVLLLIGVHSMVEYPLWYGPFLMALGLCGGLLLGTGAAQQKEEPLSQSSRSFIAIKLIAVGLLCFAGFAGFDYHRVSQIYLSTESRSQWYGDDALATAHKSVLFGRQARFAELMVTPVSAQNAVQVLNLALDLVHYSPEPRVIEALIESATMLHFDDVAMVHLARYKEAYPKDYAAWSALK